MNKLFSILEFPLILGAGIAGQKVAAKLWTQAFDSDPPDTGEENVRLAPLLAVAVLEGTLYKLSRMAVERGLRVAVARSTGTWPGGKGEGE